MRRIMTVVMLALPKERHSFIEMLKKAKTSSHFQPAGMAGTVACSTSQFGAGNFRSNAIKYMSTAEQRRSCFVRFSVFNRKIVGIAHFHCPQL
jgi:hypothetical protein